MNFRGVIISSENSSISISNGNVAIHSKGSKHTVPIEDIAIMLIEDMKSSISTYALSFLSSKNITVLFCDEKHNPNGVLMPLYGKIRMKEGYLAQMQLDKEKIDQLWETILKTKVSHQASILNYQGQNTPSKAIKKMIPKIKGQDNKNIESRVSVVYWKYVFSSLGVESFKRREIDIVNAALNYGYAIIRAYIAKELSVRGFFLPLGIHHHSSLNKMNLVDDIIELFRGSIDIIIVDMLGNKDLVYEDGLLGKDEKRKIFHFIMENKIKIDSRKFSLFDGVDFICTQLSGFYNNCEENKREMFLSRIESIHLYEV